MSLTQPPFLGDLELAVMEHLWDNGPGEAKDAYKGTRQVYFREAGGFLDTQIYDRERLGAGSALEGPAIIEERTSTTLVPKGFNAKVDDYGNITLRRSP